MGLTLRTSGWNSQPSVHGKNSTHTRVIQRSIVYFLMGFWCCLIFNSLILKTAGALKKRAFSVFGLGICIYALVWVANTELFIHLCNVRNSTDNNCSLIMRYFLPYFPSNYHRFCSQNYLLLISIFTSYLSPVPSLSVWYTHTLV
jgi:hypothetical protein